MKQERLYTKEILQEAVNKSITISDVCRQLGKIPKGGIFELIRNRINEYQINTDHFLGQAAVAGIRNPNFDKRRTKEEILVDNCLYRISHKALKRALMESGREYKCEYCNLNSWNNKPITLDVDHIDGNWKNCKEENLRFLCPNCHRQTDTFGTKNIKGINKKVYKCECGNIKGRRSIKCKSCENKSRKR